MYNIYLKETASYLNSLIGYLVIGIFLIVTGLICWVFPDTSILDSGFASLDGFFNLAPYLFLFLIPAVTMRSIAGEKADGTYELLVSRPVKFEAIVLGKFLAGLVVTLFAILPTIVYSISVYMLGHPIGNLDIGATIGSYIGLILLSGAFVSIGIFCSSLSNNSIVSFLLTVLICFILYDGMTSLATLDIIADQSNWIELLGIQSHYSSISRGVLTLTDLVYFISIVSIFLLLTIGHLKRNFQSRKKTLSIYFGVFLFVFFVNIIWMPKQNLRIDFTQDKRFTLSQSSIELLKNIDQDVYITLFLDGKLPSGFNRLKTSAIALVHDFQSYSNGRIHFNIINPTDGSQEEQREFTNALVDRGLYPTNLNVKSDDGFSQKLIFPWAMIGNGDKEIAVNLLQNRTGLNPNEVLNNSVQNLEYAFLSAIKKAISNQPSFIGFSEGHGEPSDLELYDAMQSLSVAHQVGRVNLDSTTYESLDQLAVLFVVKPRSKFSESDKYKIDYFVRRGGRVVWAIDQVDASLDHLRQTGTQPVTGIDLNLDDLFFVYGARFNYNLVADLSCSQMPLTVGNIGGQPQIELAPWYFFPILMPNSSHPVVKNLDGISTEFIGTIDTINAPNIKKEILLSSSPFTRIINTPNTISLQMVEQKPDPKEFKTKPSPVAVILAGKFPYLFKDRPAPDGIVVAKDLNDVSNESKMVLMADGDWLINKINAKDQSPYPLGWDRYTEQQFANKIFLENIVDYLINDESLIQLRNKEIKLRLLDQSTIKSDKLIWQFLNVGAPLLILVLIGTIQQYIRKRKFGKTS